MQPIRGKALSWLVAGHIACGISFATTSPTLYAAEVANFDNFQPFDSNQLLQQAIIAAESRDFQIAEQSASDALQIIKVNHGLKAAEQFPALQLLAETLLTQNRWQALDQHLGYFEWLLENLVTKDFEAYLTGTEILHRLYLCAAAETNNSQNAHYLIAAKQLNWRTVTAIERHMGNNSLTLAPWLYNIVLTHFYQSTLTRRKGLTSYDYKSEKPEIVSGWSLRKNESVRQSYRVGLELLKRIRNLYASTDQPSIITDALMLLYVADWEWLFERESAALSYYQQAYQQLRAASVPADELAAWFARPAIVPRAEFISNWQPQPWQPESQLTFVAWTEVFPGAHLPENLSRKMNAPNPQYEVHASINLAPVKTAVKKFNNSTEMYFASESLNIESIMPAHNAIELQARNRIGDLRFRPMIFDTANIPWKEFRLNYVFSTGTELNLLGTLP